MFVSTINSERGENKVPITGERKQRPATKPLRQLRFICNRPGSGLDSQLFDPCFAPLSRMQNRGFSFEMGKPASNTFSLPIAT